jgi:D-aspartate ligase
LQPNVLIIGTDINAYYMARCYYELYQTKADLIGRVAMPFTSLSKITNVSIVSNLIEPKIFLDTLISYAKKHPSAQKILLIGTNDTYVRLIAEYADTLERYYLFNYPSKEIMDTLLVKETFYSTYANSSLTFPKTFIYACDGSMKVEEVKQYFSLYPLIIKPSDGITYHEIDDLAKVYKIVDEISLEKTLQKIENLGYHGHLIIQEFIPGDDSALHDCLFYCGKDKKARVATFAQIGLQEHTPTGIGNCTVLVNGFSQYGYPEDLIYQLKDFLESIGYQGFAEFDLKYDVRDQKFKVFEINPRQSRSGYYLSACGYNLVDLLVKDLYTNELNFDFEIAKEKMVLSFVPKRVMKQYILSKPLKEEIKRLIKQKKLIHPIAYSKDMSLKRRKYLFMRALNYQKKYQKYHF